MTEIEKTIEDIQKQFKGIGIDYTNGKDMTAVCILGDKAEIVIEALREYAEQQDPKPLTLDELRQMDGCNDGTPIWIEPTGKYEGVWTAAWYIWPWDTKDFEIDTYADAWLAYRSKPKEEHHEAD